MSQHRHIKLLPLVSVLIHLLDLVSEAPHHAALEAAPGAHLGVPADERARDVRILLDLSVL